MSTLAISNKTFTVTSYIGGLNEKEYTGTVEVDGGFAIINEIKDSKIVATIIIPATQIQDITYKT